MHKSIIVGQVKSHPGNTFSDSGWKLQATGTKVPNSLLSVVISHQYLIIQAFWQSPLPAVMPP